MVPSSGLARHGLRLRLLPPEARAPADLELATRLGVCPPTRSGLWRWSHDCQQSSAAGQRSRGTTHQPSGQDRRGADRGQPLVPKPPVHLCGQALHLGERRPDLNTDAARCCPHHGIELVRQVSVPHVRVILMVELLSSFAGRLEARQAGRTNCWDVDHEHALGCDLRQKVPDQRHVVVHVLQHVAAHDHIRGPVRDRESRNVSDEPAPVAIVQLIDDGVRRLEISAKPLHEMSRSTPDIDDRTTNASHRVDDCGDSAEPHVLSDAGWLDGKSHDPTLVVGRHVTVGTAALLKSRSTANITRQP